MFSIFRDLQDLKSFAPLQFQFVSKCSSTCLMIVYQNVISNFAKIGIAHQIHRFSNIFLWDQIILSEFFETRSSIEVVLSVIEARLQHSFDGHRARATFIFLLYFSLQHFNFLLVSVPRFPFSHQYFETISSNDFFRIKL